MLWDGSGQPDETRRVASEVRYAHWPGNAHLVRTQIVIAVAAKVRTSIKIVLQAFLARSVGQCSGSLGVKQDGSDVGPLRSRVYHKPADWYSWSVHFAC
jgi:hypothetical protein